MNTRKTDFPERNYDYQRSIEVILYLEESFKVYDFEFEGDSLWPIYRMELWLALTTIKNRGSKLSARPSALGNLKFSFKNILRSVKAIPSFKKDYFTSLGSFLTSLNSTIVFFSKPYYYHFTEEKGLMDVHLDPLQMLLNELESSSLKWSWTFPENVKDELFRTPLVIDKVSALNQYQVWKSKNLRQYLKRKRSLKKSISKFDRILFGEYKQSIWLSERNQWIDQFLFKNWFYDNLFSVLGENIRTLITCYYYEIDSMQMFKSARQHGIRTIDVQHGKQGTPHGMYTHWHHLPNKGNSYLPTTFWNWGKTSTQQINDWLSKELSERHYAQSLGFAKLAMLKNKKLVEKLDSDVKEFIEKAKEKTLILFTAQHDAAIPDFVVQRMSKAKKEELWLIRLHPSISKFDKISIKEMLWANSVSNFEMNYANILDIHTLLNISNRHITRWSSTAYEALAFGLKTILVDKNGYDLFKPMVDRNEFIFVDDFSSFDQALEQESMTIDSDYIIANEASIKSRLAELI